MSSDWVSGMCNEKSGFLFSHSCDRPAKSDCFFCHKPVCSEHVHQHEEGQVCTSCAKAKMKENRARGKRQYERDHYYDDDPYFYSGYYFNGYGYYGRGYWGHDSYSDADPHDFTEADGASMSLQDDEDFESDMGES